MGEIPIERVEVTCALSAWGSDSGHPVTDVSLSNTDISVTNSTDRVLDRLKFVSERARGLVRPTESTGVFFRVAAGW